MIKKLRMRAMFWEWIREHISDESGFEILPGLWVK
jgi:hypothetical protein